MSCLLLVNNLLSQDCYIFADYSQICLSETKKDYLSFYPRRLLHPRNSQWASFYRRVRKSAKKKALKKKYVRKPDSNLDGYIDFKK